MRISDWSSDVCSSDLISRRRQRDGKPLLYRPAPQYARGRGRAPLLGGYARARAALRSRRDVFRPVERHDPDRKSVVKGKGVSVRLDLGCTRIIKKKNTHTRTKTHSTTNKHTHQ